MSEIEILQWGTLSFVIVIVLVGIIGVGLACGTGKIRPDEPQSFDGW